MHPLFHPFAAGDMFGSHGHKGVRFMKRIVTIQDISCVGKCSLTVALPVISACGVETAVIPTAVLSTHTAFPSFTFRDLTDEISPVAENWKNAGIGFDAIYTGYLGSERQIALMERFFADFRTQSNLIFVDPVMADNGKMYAGFAPEFADSMARLCAKADIIVPNMSEACFMLRRDYMDEGYSETDIKALLKQLTGLGCPTAVLTGVSFEKDRIGVMAYDAQKDDYFCYFTEKVPQSFHGTGDVFSSACVGALMRGLPLDGALKTAANFTLACIKETVKNPVHNWYGVDFETALPALLRELEANR